MSSLSVIFCDSYMRRRIFEVQGESQTVGRESDLQRECVPVSKHTRFVTKYQWGSCPSRGFRDVREVVLAIGGEVRNRFHLTRKCSI